MSNPNPWQSFIDAAERKAFQSDVMVSLKGWATNWLEANAMKGDKGDQGVQGERGLRGLQGERGPKGDRGPRGYDGKDGKMGPIGPQGKPGKDGRNGKDGKDGRDGKDGKRGQRGPKGEKGDKGDRGPIGPQGPPGTGGGGSVNRYRFLGGTADPNSREGFADDKYINYTSKEIFYRSDITDNWTSLGTLGAGGGGGGTWGSITGTLSDQTDLQDALDLKAPLASPALTGTPTAPTLQANNSGGGTLKSNSGTTALSWGGGGGANVTIANALQMTARTANRALVTDGSKNVISSATTDTELGYLSGVTSAVQTQLNAKIPSTEKGAANGVAPLDASSKIASTYLPTLALSEVFVVANEAAQLALTAEEGDVAVRTDENKSYIHNGGTAGDMTDWQELLTPTDAVLSVNGQTGVVSLDTGDVAEGSNLYFTNERVDDRVNALLQEGSNVTLTYNDVANTLTIDATDTDTTDHTALSNIGTNTHAQIDSHIASTSNPHSVSASDVGNTTAQWNADQLQGVDVASTSPSDGQGLVYNSSNSRWEPGTATGSLPLYFKAQGTSTANPVSSAVDLTWGTPAKQDSAYTLGAVNTYEITINQTGWYEIACTAGINNTNRSQLNVQLHVDTGSGYSAISTEIDSNYNTRDGDQDEGTTQLDTLYYLNSGDKIKFVASGTSDTGSPALVPNKTRLVIVTHTNLAASDTFLNATDTPSSYSGQGGNAVRVNSGENALEFYNPWAPPTSTDAAASNGEIFYSSDQSALCYKDSGGTVYRLHGGPAVYASSL